jgi:glycosyl hydrolase family 106( putative alpha-L-rhamnosidase)
MTRTCAGVIRTILIVLLFSFTTFLEQPAQSFSALAATQATVGKGIDELQRLFQNPPDDSRIMMRWWWFGPAVTRPQLEREMRLMKEGGIGGFEVQPVYPLVLDDPSAGIKSLPLLSDQFIEVLRFTSEKARELGLRFDLTLGSGWPYGGPHVMVSQAAGRLRCERVKIDDPARRVKVPDMVKVPDIGPGEKLLAVFVARAQGQAIAPDSLKEITDIKDGAAWLPDSLAGPIEVFFFIASRTGQQVKRPALGGEGFVMDHLDRAALDNYLKNVGDRMMQGLGSNPPYAIFCDSLEVYNSDWTGDFLEEFQKRRGYDLKPYLAALVTDIGPKTAAIRRDWGKTLTELLNERFLAPLRDWSKKNRTLLRIQCYGVPAAALSSNVYADLSEGEGHHWKRLSTTRWASSASHIYGRRVTSSEVWTWLHSPSFRATPLDVKAEADRHFLQGINQLIGHGWPYTAEGIDYPGWRFYAAGVFNEKNPWWIVMPDVSRYLQRISFLLRQGQPANDVAIYLPNDDGWARFRNGNTHMVEALREVIGPDVIARVLEAGYNFDFFDDDAFKQVGRVERGALVLGPNKYKAVILPSVERIPLDTLQKLEEFARGGGVLIATRRTPVESPGFTSTQADQQKLLALSLRVFDGTAGHVVTDESGQLAGLLGSLLRPDLALEPATPEIGFVHRKTDDAEIYFLANTANVSKSVKATFRVQGMKPEWWDPMTGNLSPAHTESQSEADVTVRLNLEPYGSRVLIFTRRALSRPQAANSPSTTPTVDLSTGWQVSFGPGSKPVQYDNLRSWTDDEKTRYFSGPAVYEKTVVAPDNLFQDGLAVRLDFGEGQAIAEEPYRPPRGAGMHAALEGPVREAAVVYVNDRRAGSIWCPPYWIDVTSLLRRGENKIRIVVANTAINHMAGRALPDYRLLNLRYGERFQAQDMDKVQPIRSGLLGPIRLIATAR